MLNKRDNASPLGLANSSFWRCCGSCKLIFCLLGWGFQRPFSSPSWFCLGFGPLSKPCLSIALCWCSVISSNDLECTWDTANSQPHFTQLYSRRIYGSIYSRCLVWNLNKLSKTEHWKDCLHQAPRVLDCYLRKNSNSHILGSNLLRKQDVERLMALFPANLLALGQKPGRSGQNQMTS